MSDQVIINELLTYLQNELGVADEEAIVKICMQTYDKADITEAREIIYKALNKDTYVPSYVMDQDGQSSLRDIIDCIKDTDTSLQPTFVARNWRNLPMVSIDQEVFKKISDDILDLRLGMAKIQLDCFKVEKKRAHCGCCSYSQGSSRSSKATSAGPVIQETSSKLAPSKPED